MVIGNLLYSVDIKPGDIERLQAKLENLQQVATKSVSGTSGASQAASSGIKSLRNEVASLTGEFHSGQMSAKQYAVELTRIRDAAVAQMNSMLATQGATVRTSAEYARLASVAGNTSLMLNQMGAAQSKVTMGQQLLLGATRALRFQLVRLGPVGYGTSIMFTSMAAAMAGASSGSVGLAGKVERLRATIFGLNNVIMLSGVLALISLGVAAFKASRAIVEIENAQAEVARTTAFTSDELWELTGAFQAISIEIGASTTELLDIAAVAGQLGIRGVKNVAEFSDTLARLARVTDIVGEEGATQLARFLNITGTAVEDLGSEAIVAGNIINELGNTTAASAAEILKMGSEIAQVRAVANVSKPDLFAIGATLRSVGISAELAGTNLTKVFDKMIFAALDGGQALATWSRVAGVTTDRFKEMVKENPADALQQLALGLKTARDNGQELLPILDEMGFKNIRERRIMAGLVLAYDVLNQARQTAAEQVAILNGELDEQASIDAELERRMNTTSFQWRRFVAQIGVVLQIIGEGLLPHMRAMVDAFIENRDKVVIVGSSIVTLIDTLKYLGEVFKGAGQIILGFAAGTGGALGEMIFQIEEWARKMKAAAPLMADISGWLTNPIKAGRAMMNIGDVLGDNPFSGERIGEAFERHSEGIGRGMDTINIAIEEYMSAIARIPETQAKMMGSLTELTNNIENMTLRDELIAMLGEDWGEDWDEAANGPKNVMEELAKTLEAIDRFTVAYQQIDPNFDGTKEKVSALNGALRELAEQGFGVDSWQIQEVVRLLRELGVELEDLSAHARKVNEQNTTNYLEKLEIDLVTGARSIASVVEELKFQENKLLDQLKNAQSFEDAKSILTRLQSVRSMLNSLEDPVAAAASRHGQRVLDQLLALEAAQAEYYQKAIDDAKDAEEARAEAIEATRERHAQRVLDQLLEIEANYNAHYQQITDDAVKAEEDRQEAIAAAKARHGQRVLDQLLEIEAAMLAHHQQVTDDAVQAELDREEAIAEAKARHAQRVLDQLLAIEAALVAHHQKVTDDAVKAEEDRQEAIAAAKARHAQRVLDELLAIEAAMLAHHQKVTDDAVKAEEERQAAIEAAKKRHGQRVLDELLMIEAAQLDYPIKAMEEYKDIVDDVMKAAGLAPAIFDTWRAAIWAAAYAAGGLTDEMRDLLDLIDQMEDAAAAQQLVSDIQTGINVARDFAEGFRAFQNGDIESGIKKTGAGIAEVIGLMSGIPGLGALFEQAFEVAVMLLGDMSNGVKQVREQIEGMQRDFTFFNAEDLVVTERVSRGGLLGLFGLTKEAVNEELTELNTNIAGAIESGLLSGFTSGIREFMISGVWDDLSLVVKDALLNGLIEAYLQSEVFKEIFGDALAEYIKNPSAATAEAVLAGVPAFQEFWEQVRNDFGDFFGDLGESSDADDTDFQVLRPIDQVGTSMVAPLPSINPVIAAPSWLMEMGSHVTRFGGYVDQLTTEGITVRVSGGVGNNSMRLNSARTAV